MAGNAEDILDYLRTARDLEKNKFALEQIENNIRNNIAEIESRTYPDFVPPADKVRNKESLEGGGCGLAGVLGVIGAVGGVVFEYLHEGQYYLSRPLEFIVLFPIPALICAVVGAALLFGVGMAISSIVTAPARTRADKEIFEAKKSWELEIAKKKDSDKAAADGFREDLACLSETRRIEQEILRNHYMDGPVYHKYQSLPAICQLYEYFESGRFSALGDAYNQYELELRLDRLIDTTEKAYIALTQIRNNQRVLYDVLVDAKNQLTEINSNLDYCAKTLDQIAYNQEVTKVCLQQTAVATALLSQVEYYKNRHDLPITVHALEGELIGLNARLLANR